MVILASAWLEAVVAVSTASGSRCLHNGVQCRSLDAYDELVEVFEVDRTLTRDVIAMNFVLLLSAVATCEFIEEIIRTVTSRARALPLRS